MVPRVVGSLSRRGRYVAGQLTRVSRVLPDYLIIGAQRAGTATLYYNLTGHPAVLPASRKEVHYFDLHFPRGPAWYRGHFPSRAAVDQTRRRTGGVAVAGEASPDYLFHPAAPGRAAATVPGARLIILLRNPIDRAYSHHQREVLKGRETLPFHRAIAEEPRRLAADAARASVDQAYGVNHRRFSYLARGRYLSQLRAWRACYPVEQMLVLESEAFFQHPARIWREVLAFLELPAWEPARFEWRNALSYQPLDPAMRAALRDHFRPDVEALVRYLGRPQSWDI